MNILYLNWKSFAVDDIRTALQEQGHQVILYPQEPRDYRLDPRYKSELKRKIREKGIDLIFSSNYYPIISNACNETDILYVSWCYDSPLVNLYSHTVFHPCNFIFHFDSAAVQELQQLGVKHVYYLPMAVNARRLAAITVTQAQRQLLEADVSFVGSLYTEQHNLYERLVPRLDAHTRGYLEGIMAAQRKVYGYHFIEELLTPDIVAKLNEVMPVPIGKDDRESLSYIYANYFLCRKMTQMDRLEILERIGDALASAKGTTAQRVKLYTPAPTPFLENVKNMGKVQYEKEMPAVFQSSKINLNITLRSIKNGIPLRAMDIMGAGGFLLTNYQNDFQFHFKEGQDYVYYESIPDLLDKIQYYLTQEKERCVIAENGCRKVREHHTYEKRMKEIFAVLHREQ